MIHITDYTPSPGKEERKSENSYDDGLSGGNSPSLGTDTTPKGFKIT